MALAALLSCIIPLHFGLLTVGLGRRRFISGNVGAVKATAIPNATIIETRLFMGVSPFILSQAGNRRTTLP